MSSSAKDIISGPDGDGGHLSLNLGRMLVLESSLNIAAKSTECEENTPSVLIDRLMNLTLL